MSPAEFILYHLARRWPAPTRALRADDNLSREAYHLAYARKMQFNSCVENGIHADIQGKEILEIGCGHGGISCFLALNGARRVLGIDLNTYNLDIAEKFQRQVAQDVSGNPDARLNVEFSVKNAAALDLPADCFDIVWAENVFEHFTEPEAVMNEAFRVLRPGGRLIVPIFSSIYSKHGAHLKQGLKVPWSNLFFSEKTICATLYRMAQKQAVIFDMYPGLAGKPLKIRDLRQYKDLNDITFGKFRRMALNAGFKIESFSCRAPGRIRFANRLIAHIPGLRNSLLLDIFSTGARAVLRKPQ